MELNCLKQRCTTRGCAPVALNKLQIRPDKIPSLSKPCFENGDITKDKCEYNFQTALLNKK